MIIVSSGGGGSGGAGGYSTQTNYTGANCTGTDGTANRTLVHSATLSTTCLIFIGGRILFKTLEYTVSDATITFLVIIDNTDNIMVVN